jgi:hypothetical protein
MTGGVKLLPKSTVVAVHRRHATLLVGRIAPKILAALALVQRTEEIPREGWAASAWTIHID